VLLGLLGGGLGLNNVGEVAIVVLLEEVLGVGVDLDGRDVDGRGLGDVVVAALALLLLELERDATDGATLDAAHQVGGVTGNLVAEALGGDDSDLIENTLVGLEVKTQAGVVLLNGLARRALDDLRTARVFFLLLFVASGPSEPKQRRATQFVFSRLFEQRKATGDQRANHTTNEVHLALTFSGVCVTLLRTRPCYQNGTCSRAHSEQVRVGEGRRREGREEEAVG